MSEKFPHKSNFSFQFMAKQYNSNNIESQLHFFATIFHFLD